jgi:hypothetical protein
MVDKREAQNILTSSIRLRYFDPPNYGQGPLIFKTTIHVFETPNFYMVLGVLPNKNQW